MTSFGPYPARVHHVHDGDTVVFEAIDLGFGVYLPGVDWDNHPLLSCRVDGINAPELNTDAGKAAYLYAMTLLRPRDRVHVVSHGWDKFGGRFDGTITLADGSDFALSMIAAGHAQPWDGTGPKPTGG